MLTFSRAILLMSMRTTYIVDNANFCKERMEFLISPPKKICLHGENFAIKLFLNHSLKFMEFLKNLRFIFQQIDPSKFTVIINEANIILFSPNRLWCRTLDIREYKFQRKFRFTERPRIW